MSRDGSHFGTIEGGGGRWSIDRFERESRKNEDEQDGKDDRRGFSRLFAFSLSHNGNESYNSPSFSSAFFAPKRIVMRDSKTLERRRKGEKELRGDGVV